MSTEKEIIIWRRYENNGMILYLVELIGSVQGRDMVYLWVFLVALN